MRTFPRYLRYASRCAPLTRICSVASLPLAVLFFSLYGTPSASAQVSVDVDTVTPPSLGRAVEYRVVLPAGYDTTRRYPVLWLLHGYGGGDADWLELTSLRRYVDRYPLIVILPDAMNSWYVDAPGDSASHYEAYLAQDLPADVIRRYAVDTSRQAIAGLSMGGYGALTMGMRYPRRFRFVGAMSAALSVPSRHDPVLEGARPSITRAFGARPSAHWDAHDPFLLFRMTPAASLPFFYLAIGESDGFPTFLGLNRALTDSLREYGASYEYHERPGGHDWRLWNAELQPMLARMWIELTALRIPETHTGHH